jgi:hypothetical protein
MGRTPSVRTPFSVALTPQLAFARSDETPEVAGITAVRMKITGMLADGPDLEGGIERVEIEVDAPRHEPGHEPKFERHVQRAELHRGQTDMVVGIDKPRQHNLSAGAEDRDFRVFCDQLCGGTDLGDDAVALQYRAVIDLMPMAAVSVTMARARIMLESTASLPGRVGWTSEYQHAGPS